MRGLSCSYFSSKLCLDLGPKDLANGYIPMANMPIENLLAQCGSGGSGSACPSAVETAGSSSMETEISVWSWIINYVICVLFGIFVSIGSFFGFSLIFCSYSAFFSNNSASYFCAICYAAFVSFSIFCKFSLFQNF